MERARRVAISKRLSLALRHEPASLGLELDERGWATVASVLAGLGAAGDVIGESDLTAVVTSSDKQRFAFSEDGLLIRANQGHSVDIELGLSPSEPPLLLLHGTSAKLVEIIRHEGLRPGARTHVHLSPDQRTAQVVAKRREGPHVILRVRALAMHRAGHAFFLSANGVWLTAHVPPPYLDS